MSRARDIANGVPMGGNDDQVFYENETTISSNYTISSGYNAGSFGPVTVSASATVTVPNGSVWVVV